jgi:uncharacterized protein YmfQ (DUF2313 family)
MNHYTAIKKLFPLDLGPISDSDMQIEGALLDAAMQTMQSVLDEMSPSTAVQTLTRWENEFGIKTGIDITQRRNAIIAKMRERATLKKGGLRRGIYIAIADAMGYDIAIIEAPSVFRAGISKAGDPVYSKSKLWVWTVIVNNASSASNLEALFNDIKPPYSRIEFQYV